MQSQQPAGFRIAQSCIRKVPVRVSLSFAVETFLACKEPTVTLPIAAHATVALVKPHSFVAQRVWLVQVGKVDHAVQGNHDKLSCLTARLQMSSIMTEP